MIRDRLAQLVTDAIRQAQSSGDLPAFPIQEVAIDRPQKPEWGDYSSPVSMKLASLARRAPLQIAGAIARHIAPAEYLERVDTAPPGFINFRLAPDWLTSQIARIEEAGSSFGNVDIGAGRKVQVEHVSANPTGPLTVGSARNAALGDTLARVLRAAQFQVEREYYVNDAGSQIRHFGESLYARYAQAAGRDVSFPEDGYQGAYVGEMAQEIHRRDGDRYLDLPRDEAIRLLGQMGIDSVLGSIRRTLSRMQVEFDTWFSERGLYESGQFDEVFLKLRERGLTYESEGAVWFAATRMGLEKDAVLIRSPQVIADERERPTYLASDVAYAWNKLVARGFDRAIYVWGADHHGDVARVLAATRALGLDDARIAILLYQHVLLKRGGEAVRMSKRTGEFVTLDELMDEIGADAVRFLLITRSADSTIELDLQKAREESDENPVYYAQYQHARMASILRHAIAVELSGAGANLALLQHPAELELIRQMLRLEEVVALAAQRLEPHHLPHFVLELAQAFSIFYRDCRVISSEPGDEAISKSRVRLVAAAKQVLVRALALMGVTSPDMM